MVLTRQTFAGKVMSLLFIYLFFYYLFIYLFFYL